MFGVRNNRHLMPKGLFKGVGVRASVRVASGPRVEQTKNSNFTEFIKSAPNVLKRVLKDELTWFERIAASEMCSLCVYVCVWRGV